MNGNDRLFLDNTIKENNDLVRSVLEVGPSTRIQSSIMLDLISSFRRLLTIIHGISCRDECLALEVTLSFNYSYLLLLIGCHETFTQVKRSCAVTSSPKDDAISQISTCDDVLKLFCHRVNQFRENWEMVNSLKRMITTSSEQLISVLLSVEYLRSIKLPLINLVLVDCLWLLNCGRIKKAADLTSTLVDHVLPRIEQIVSIDSSNLRLLPFCLNYESSPHTVDLTAAAKDGIFLTSAISSFDQHNWDHCLSHLRQITIYPLKNYCQYVEGFILYKKNSFDAALNILVELIKRDTLNQELQLNVQNLIGRCLSAQGKHRCAIQIYKKCLQESSTFFLPLFNIALQYRKLLLVDAEIEALQLLVKLLQCDSRQNQKAGIVPRLVEFGAVTGHLLVADCPDINTCKALYVLAKRCLDLKRYNDAVESFSKLLFLLTNSGLSDDIMTTSGDDDLNDDVPSISLIYAMTIYANLCAGRYENVVVCCDVVLTKLVASSSEISRFLETSLKNDEDAQISGRLRTLKVPSSAAVIQENSIINAIPSSSSSSTKRLREDDSVDRLLPRNGEAVTVAATLMSKSDALFNSGKMDDALRCLNKAIHILETNWTSSTTGNERETSNKKTKMDPTHVDPNQSSISMQILRDAYCFKGLFSVRTGRSQDALHWFRLAYQLNTENVENVYNLTLILFKLRRDNEASSLWLSHRRLLPSRYDVFQIDALYKQFSAAIREIAPNDATSDKSRYSFLDLEALTVIKKRDSR